MPNGSRIDIDANGSFGTTGEKSRAVPLTGSDIEDNFPACVTHTSRITMEMLVGDTALFRRKKALSRKRNICHSVAEHQMHITY